MKKPKAQRLAADPSVTPSPANGEIGRGRNSCDYVTPKEKHGSNGAEYLIRRLKRDAPAIAEALARGEYPSARAAGIAAGIVKVRTTLEWVWHRLGRCTPDEQVAIPLNPRRVLAVSVGKSDVLLIG
jgi:hypothetical protein